MKEDVAILCLTMFVYLLPPLIIDTCHPIREPVLTQISLKKVQRQAYMLVPNAITQGRRPLKPVAMGGNSACFCYLGDINYMSCNLQHPILRGNG